MSQHNDKGWIETCITVKENYCNTYSILASVWPSKIEGGLLDMEKTVVKTFRLNNEERERFNELYKKSGCRNESDFIKSRILYESFMDRRMAQRILKSMVNVSIGIQEIQCDAVRLKGVLLNTRYEPWICNMMKNANSVEKEVKELYGYLKTM